MPSCGGPSTEWAITFEGLRDLLHKFPEVNYGFEVVFEFPLRPLRLCERPVFSIAPRRSWPNGPNLSLAKTQRKFKG
jgi:hypothetical protein